LSLFQGLSLPWMLSTTCIKVSMQWTHLYERVCFVSARELLVVFAVDMFIDLQLWTWDCCIIQVALGVCWKLEIDYGRDQRLRKYWVMHKGQFTQIHLAAMKALSMCIPNLRGMGILPPSPFMFTACSWIFDPLICSCELELKSRVMDTWWF
jgi:hypothetical protein